MPVAYDLAGRTAVVTGGAGGIGRTIAERLRQSGARVIVWDIAPREQDRIRSLVVDVTDPEQVTTALLETLDERSQIDILVNSVGHLGSYGPFERQAAAEWPEILGANLFGLLEVCRRSCRTCDVRGRVGSSPWARLPEARVGQPVRVLGGECRRHRLHEGSRGGACRHGDPGQLRGARHDRLGPDHAAWANRRRFDGREQPDEAPRDHG
jgi:hypothetical protein